MKIASILLCLTLASCVTSTTTAPDGTVTKTSSFSPTDAQLAAAQAIAGDVTAAVQKNSGK